MIARLIALVIIARAMAFTPSALAEDLSAPWLDELRVGGAWPRSVQFEALFSPLPPAEAYNANLSWLLSPRPLVGVSVSVAGKTNQAYAGLAWTVPILGPWFAEASVGGLVHDQKLNQSYGDRPLLTSRVLFRESIAVGYEFAPGWSVLAFANHASNGNLGYRNISMNQFGVALGAKLGERAAPVAAAGPALPPFDWAGPYAGFGVGLADGRFNFTAPAPTAVTPKKQSVNLGVQLGYNWQAGPVVLGLETDYSAQSLEGSAMVVSAGEELSASSHWIATARGRVGASLDIPLLSPQSWLYGTAGVAVSNVAKNFCPMGPPPQCYSNGDIGVGWSTVRELRAGWTAGAGLEVPVARRVTIKGEYLYADFGKLHYTNGVSINEFSFSQHLVRVGVNFH